ncbi:MAG: hypothetical protein O7E57_06205 [Gammaproteobacteria bacterium]|nr:hypothetical protein [Gammaproteobacteria bacterium]
MKLATFTSADDDSPRLGVVRNDGMVDLSRASPALPNHMIGLLAEGDDALVAARAAADSARTVIDMSEVELRAPVTFPGKVLAIGLNYGDHKPCRLENPSTHMDPSARTWSPPMRWVILMISKFDRG